MENKHPYIEMIRNREPVIFDGAMGTEIQKAEPSAADYGDHAGCCEYLNVSRPDIIEAIHVRYLEAGANVIETNTFGGSRPKLAEFGLGDRVHEINKAAAAVARRAVSAGRGLQRQNFVCGSIGPTGFLPSSSDKELSGVTFDELVDIFKEQATGLLDGGADILLVETSQDLLEVRAAILGIRQAAKSVDRYVPIQVQATMDGSGKMLLGSDVSAFLGAVQGMGVDVVGLNCGAGPDEMGIWIEELLRSSPIPVSMLPNAGLPCNEDGKAVYKMGAEEFAEKVSMFVRDKGVSVAGGCCGTTPEHIGALAKTLENSKSNSKSNSNSNSKSFYEDGGYPRNAPPKTDNAKTHMLKPNYGGKIFHEGKFSTLTSTSTSTAACFLGTGISGADLEGMRRPIIIGERLNAQGSKKTKEYIVGKNYDELYHIANEQVERGSDLIDICVAANELDISEAEMMGNVVKFLSDRVAVPFCIDSTEPAVLEVALKKSPGAVLINSINLEHGGEKARRVLSLAADFGCPVIALTIDGAGMAATADRKFEVACQLRTLACEEFGLPEHYIYIDPLVFTLATGDAATANAALESLEALRRIKKEYPNIRTAMGVSNVSFGLKPKSRRVLNNLMLHYAAEAGLDAAIFNPLHVDDVGTYDPKIRELADDLLLNRRGDSLQRYVEHFESQSAESSPQKSGKGKNSLADNAGNAELPEERLRGAVLNRDKRNLPDVIDSLLKTHAASDILNKILLPAMAEVGDRMAAGEMILPFVLQAAEVMKESVSILEPHLKASGGGAAKGKMIIATVYGDVHDIGKNLVASILRNQGFDVIDLGKQVSVDTIVEAARREKPDIVGLSALLVTTSQEMGKCVKEFARQGIDVPIIIGGAAVNRDFAAKISALDDGSAFAPGVHYAKDAFGVVKLFDELKSGASAKQSSSPRKNDTIPKSYDMKSDTIQKRSDLKYDYHIEPPFYGTGGILTWSAAALIESIDREHLFKAWWGGGNMKPDDYESARREEFEPVFDRLTDEVIKDALVDARAFYGFFPVISEGETLVVLDPSDNSTERLSFVFPRMPKSGVSLADYVRPDGDVISVQAVTIGAKLGDRCRELLLNQDRYSDGYYLNGLGNYLTETAAGKVMAEIRRALGLPKDAGRRYSFGYAGMPDLSEQARLIEYLGIEERLGITLTDGFQMQPEHSTIAIFVHHPDAQYLS